MSKKKDLPQTFTREEIEEKRAALVHTRVRIRLDLATYEGSIRILDLLLDPSIGVEDEQPPAANEEAEQTME